MCHDGWNDIQGGVFAFLERLAGSEKSARPSTSCIATGRADMRMHDSEVDMLNVVTGIDVMKNQAYDHRLQHRC